MSQTVFEFIPFWRRTKALAFYDCLCPSYFHSILRSWMFLWERGCKNFYSCIFKHCIWNDCLLSTCSCQDSLVEFPSALTGRRKLMGKKNVWFWWDTWSIWWPDWWIIRSCQHQSSTWASCHPWLRQHHSVRNPSLGQFHLSWANCGEQS